MSETQTQGLTEKMNKDYKQIRQIFEGSDPFVSGGHKVVGLRRRKRVIPEWAQNDKKIQEILLRSFPKLKINARQRAGAARWARIIHLYFRLRWTYHQIADELGMPARNLNSMIRNIRRVAAGNRADTGAKRSTALKGRPRNNATMSGSMGNGKE
jgi:hypothetical protein